MASCTGCGATIVSGGQAFADGSCCTGACAERAALLIGARHVPPAEVDAARTRMQARRCPSGNGPGPLAVHEVSCVTSMILFTARRDEHRLGCASCGRRAKLGGMTWTAALGWWGVPFGLILTPRALMRNARGLSGPPDPALLRRAAATEAAEGWMTKAGPAAVARALAPLHKARRRRGPADAVALAGGLGLFSAVLWLATATKFADDYLGLSILAAVCLGGALATLLFTRISHVPEATLPPLSREPERAAG